MMMNGGDTEYKIVRDNINWPGDLDLWSFDL